jgi:glutamyl-tRNA synthetase
MIVTRFAPSPTGLLHVGSIRPILVNYLFAKQAKGKFILRIDDTDLARCSDYYKQQILQDLQWLGIKWDDIFYQSQRLDRYNQVVKLLLESGRLYECFESPEELDLKRKTRLSSGKPPIYDRSALKLTYEQKLQYIERGRKPCYRFKLEDKDIVWDDLIRSSVRYKGQDLSDPIVIRQDGSFTYMLCSAIDDYDYNISHIFRGEDHINNTAIQLQMLEAMSAKIPQFGHLSFLKAKDDKISKRVGGYEVAKFITGNFQPMAINSFFAYIGTSKPIVAKNNLQELIDDFDIKVFSPSPTIYTESEIEILNHKLLIQLDFSDVADSFCKMGLAEIDEEFWLAVRKNLNILLDVKLWWQICKSPIIVDPEKLDRDFLEITADLLPSGKLDQDSWGKWTDSISEKTGRRGKDLFMPLRIALTGLQHGPEMRLLLPIIGRHEIERRIGICI